MRSVLKMLLFADISNAWDQNSELTLAGFSTVTDIIRWTLNDVVGSDSVISLHGTRLQ